MSDEREPRGYATDGTIHWAASRKRKIKKKACNKVTRHCSSGKFIKTGGAKKGYKKEMMMMFSASSNLLDHKAKKKKIEKGNNLSFLF